MQYPNKIKKDYQKVINYSNRGLDLEEIIEEANVYYRKNDLAYIYKKPTPIGVAKVCYQNGERRIKDAFYKMPSTLDFNGLYKGYYIEFDAKATINKTAFPLNNIHAHQLEHIKNIHRHGGIVFLIISMNGEYYLLDGKSYVLKYNYVKGLDYLSVLDVLIGGLNEKKEKC